MDHEPVEFGTNAHLNYTSLHELYQSTVHCVLHDIFLSKSLLKYCCYGDQHITNNVGAEDSVAGLLNVYKVCSPFIQV